MNAVHLCYDLGPGRGLGHRRRMEALAAALGPRGIECTLSPIDGPVRAQAIVVDSYVHRADDESLFAAAFTAAVDDLERDLAVDLVVDPVPDGIPETHVAANAVLAGSAYALIDESLRRHRDRPSQEIPSVVLVTTGATDEHRVGGTIAREIASLVPELEVRLVLGQWSTRETMQSVHAVVEPDGLGEELRGADIVITAGGVTMLEALCVGRPCVAVITAENQRRYVEAAARAGALLHADLKDAATIAARLIDDPGLRASLVHAGQTLVDGLGAVRVADAIIDACTPVWM